LAQEFTEKITQRLKELKKAGIPGAKGAAAKWEEYNPLFMNDAAIDQDVFATYRDNKKFSAIQSSVDPKGFFSKRAGGFKNFAASPARAVAESPKGPAPVYASQSASAMPKGHSHGMKI
jgi:hypothetical protein